MKVSGGGGNFDVGEIQHQRNGIKRNTFVPGKKATWCCRGSERETDTQTEGEREKTNPFPPLGCHS